MAVRLEDYRNIEELVAMSIGTDKGRWWADPDFGSDLWLLRRVGKVNDETPAIFKQMILESLDWLREDGVVSTIHCETHRQGTNSISYTLRVNRPNNQSTNIQGVWNAIST